MFNGSNGLPSMVRHCIIKRLLVLQLLLGKLEGLKKMCISIRDLGGILFYFFLRRRRKVEEKVLRPRH